MKQTRKTITLSDGSKLTVRKLSAMDFLKAGVKNMPNMIGDHKEESGVTPKELEAKFEQAQAEFTALMIRAIAGCGLVLIGADGKKTSIVNKPLHELRDDEIVIEQLGDEDIRLIAETVAAFNMEVTQKASPFPVEAVKPSEPAQPS